ncbi:MAG: DNA methyltransferase, partial [Spirochaeta sp. LUC14_002_19_P3]
MHISEYIKAVNAKFQSGLSTEHSYRGELEGLIQQLVDKVAVTNEPKRQQCGAPDYIIQRNEVPLGYIEAKDIGIDLDKIKKSDQMKRYLGSLDNLILTDYLEFRFYRYGNKVTTIKVAESDGSKIKPLSDNFDSFSTHITDFCDFKGQTIKSAEKLAKMMAQKTRMMEEVLFKAVSATEDDDNTLYGQLKAFREILIHDLDEKKFADIYAQTIAYGLFAARLHDTTLDDFSRQEARDLIPRSNPFLRNLFDYVSGADLDSKVVWIVDALADILRATDLHELLKDFGSSTGQTDPFIHFYETFLAEYDSKLRKSRGVYYTPEPVVNFIVRAVDDILKNEFGLSQGLADTSRTHIKSEIIGTATKGDTRGHGKGKAIYEDKEVHKVQILDPSTGTGTFLSEVVKQIYSRYKGQEGLWSSYVEEHLLPRINGFEILMAPYTMCHLKIEMMLRETGYTPKDSVKRKRLRVFLTNSLEEAHQDTGTLFANWLSKEANQANLVKRETPVMCIIGNPPYSVESVNKGEWIMSLMEDYKKEPGGKEKLNERNPKMINDDYVKFMRFSQFFIEKNNEGILAFINPHGYLDNLTFRGMRWNLLKTYDKIYTIDLHGNSKKKESAPDGSKDENVFDIQQGVSINLLIKTGNKKPNELGKVFHYDLYGMRDDKYKFLNENSLSNIAFKELPNEAPNYFFVAKDFKFKQEYEKGFKVNELFPLKSVGILTARDNFTIHSNKEELKKTIEKFLSLDDETARTIFKLGKDVRDWQVNFARSDLERHYPDSGNITKISYRPFDEKWTYFTGKLKGFHCTPRTDVMQHFLKGENVGLSLCKQFKAGENYYHVFVSSKIIESSLVSNKTSEITSIFPLYLYPNEKNKDLFTEGQKRTPNLNKEILNQITEGLGLSFTNEKETIKNTFAPIDILDYIYAVLHSPSYREKYKEFLKIDFPGVPYPKDKDTFWQLVKLGGEIRQIHLLESPKVQQFKTEFPIDGNC